MRDEKVECSAHEDWSNDYENLGECVERDRCSVRWGNRDDSDGEADGIQNASDQEWDCVGVFLGHGFANMWIVD